MAIYSLHHTAIGKTTQARPHTAAAHVKYISRPSAMRHFESARCPDKPTAAARYLRSEEDHDRANARVADKLMLALPRELNPVQRVDLVRGFAEQVTGGRAPWLAAFHDKGKDARNPHCHLLIRDRDPKTGKRVIGTSEVGSTERFRELWEQHANNALEAAGRRERVDRRTLRAQGIERDPTIHEGPKAREMDARGAAPHSRQRGARNGYGARTPTRRVDYPRIDGGVSRPAHNRALRQKETAADYWEAVDADTRRREFEGLGHGEDARRYDDALAKQRNARSRAPKEHQTLDSHRPEPHDLGPKADDARNRSNDRNDPGHRQAPQPERAQSHYARQPIRDDAPTSERDRPRDNGRGHPDKPPQKGDVRSEWAPLQRTPGEHKRGNQPQLLEHSKQFGRTSHAQPERSPEPGEMKKTTPTKLHARDNDRQVSKAPRPARAALVLPKKPSFSERLMHERAGPNSQKTQSPSKKPSFSERLGKNRSDPKARASEKAKSRDRVKQQKGRGIGIDRG